MKYLIIEKNRAYYQLDSSGSKIEIDQISKENLLKLVELCLEDEDFEMDTFDSSSIPQAAQQIIYRNIYQKLDDLRYRRVSFWDEKSALYRKAIESYSTEIE